MYVFKTVEDKKSMDNHNNGKNLGKYGDGGKEGFKGIKWVPYCSPSMIPATGCQTSFLARYAGTEAPLRSL